MKKLIFKVSLLATIVSSSFSVVVFAENRTDSNIEVIQIIEKSKKDSNEIIENWDNLKVTITPEEAMKRKGIEPMEKKSRVARASSYSMGNSSSPSIGNSSISSIGTCGDVLVTPINVLEAATTGRGSYSGHAAIVDSNPDYTIESMPNDGVQRRPNDWKTRYSKVVGGRVVGGTKEKADAATSYAANKIGSSYNWYFYDKLTEDSFYCSQLVWRAWFDQGIDLDKDGGYFVLPTDLLSNNLEIFYKSKSY